MSERTSSSAAVGLPRTLRCGEGSCAACASCMTCTAGCIVVSVKTGHALPPLWPVRPVAKSAGCKCDFPGELHAGPTEAAGSPTLVILPSRLVTEMRFSNFRRKAVLILTLRNVRLRTASRCGWLFSFLPLAVGLSTKCGSHSLTLDPCAPPFAATCTVPPPSRARTTAVRGVFCL